VTFDESVKYLLSLGNEVLAMKLGLENITRLLAALDDPQNNYFKVQVAGTNGKGSTCAFLEAICLSAGIKTGLATSPHLISITERVRINGKDISDEDFARHATKIRGTSERLVAEGELEAVPTYFEQVTAIALYAFVEAGVELAILETGLGGRLDATTAAKAEIAVITQIDYDHQEILGHTLAEIAAEKAAVIGKDSIVIMAPQRRAAAEVINERIKSMGALDVPIDFRTEIVKTRDRGKYVVNFLSERNEYRNVKLNLRGFHQIDNALTALVTAEFLTFEFPIWEEKIITGLGRAVHPGRLEFQGDFLFDGAHNAAGAGALKLFLDEFVRGPVTLIFGAMRDKDMAEIADTLFPAAAHLILTRASNLRSVDASELRKFVPPGFPTENIIETGTVEQAVTAARAVSPRRGTICVTGSLYLVGEAQKVLNNNRYE
jgi:dihydrofolate synthase/folylpolyglutamate synthase